MAHAVSTTCSQHVDMTNSHSLQKASIQLNQLTSLTHIVTCVGQQYTVQLLKCIPKYKLDATILEQDTGQHYQGLAIR